MRSLLLLLLLVSGGNIFGDVFVMRVRNIIKLLMHVDTIEIHIFDGLLLIGCKFAFAFALVCVLLFPLSCPFSFEPCDGHCEAMCP